MKYAPHSQSMIETSIGQDVGSTPSLYSVLGGVTRDTVLELARDKGIPIEERAITRDELYVADEVFLTGTAAEVTPIRSVDHVKVGRGRRGPITQALQERFYQVVTGQTEDKWGWLQYVNTPAAATARAR